jgi:hypothetical protein
MFLSNELHPKLWCFFIEGNKIKKIIFVLMQGTEPFPTKFTLMLYQLSYVSNFNFSTKK